jgi:putative YhdH/YhfP family quinone oxidoreductase
MNGKSFKAMVVRESSDGTYFTTICRKSTDELPAGDVLIRVHYSSLNYKDILSIQGNKGVTRNYPHTPGIDAAGIVESSAVPSFKAGDSVIVTGYDLGMNTSGGFSEYIRVPGDWVVPLPENLTLKESMVYGTAGFTAGLSCHKLIENKVKPDQGKILVSGATGGVGSIAVAILSKIGYDVTAVNGHEDRTEFLKEIGARDIIPLSDVRDTSQKPLLDQKWAGVVDAVGGPFLEYALKSVRRHGTVTTCGNVSSAELKTSVFPFILRGITLAGIDSATTEMEHRRVIWNHLATSWKISSMDRIATEITGLESLDHQIECVLSHKRTGRAVVRIP